MKPFSNLCFFLLKNMTDRNETIPKIIHQMWLDKNRDNNETYPEKYKRLHYPESWKEKHPDWTFMFWNTQKVNELISKTPELAFCEPIFRNRNLPIIERCDLARYLVMYVYGGVYVDLDFQCLQSLESPPLNVTQQSKVILCFEPHEHVKKGILLSLTFQDSGLSEYISNSILMSPPKHRFWLAFLDSIKKHYNRRPAFVTPLHNTGPIKLASFVFSYWYREQDVMILPSCWFMPKQFNGNLSERCKHDDGIRYSSTNWNEGSNWGVLTLDAENQNKSSPTSATNSTPEKVDLSWSITVWRILLWWLVIVLLAFLVWAIVTRQHCKTITTTTI